MSRVLVLSHNTATCAREALPETRAVVTNGMPVCGGALLADIFNVPFRTADTVFRKSAQAVRYPATRRVLQVQGLTVYHPLNQGWLNRSNCRLARGTSAALFTAFILARSLEASHIEFRLGRQDEVVPMNLHFLLNLKTYGIQVRYLT